ncbi:MAG TPA: sigma-70 family RNA polymerase sigma factor [Jiangellaceae bacterium]|jgi:RNA polymerase sigma-70 factor (ECF subfamily)|nr:sigma-70 family RNA polymerase sigma factor [Jiangellaceae bacterium]
MRGTEAETEFTAFFRSEFRRVVRTVYLILPDRGRAEEIAQDAFVQLLDHWTKVSAYEQPDAWVRRVAIRLASRTAKRERMRAVLEGRFRPTVAAPPDEPADDVFTAVRQLPPTQRAAVVLFYVEDRPIAEIADLLGCAPATARVHLFKARQRLATMLNEEVDDVV